MTSGAIDGGVGFKWNRRRFCMRLAANGDQCPRCFCLRFSFRCSKRASASSARRWLLARTDSRFIASRRLASACCALVPIAGCLRALDALRQPDPKFAVMKYGQGGRHADLHGWFLLYVDDHAEKGQPRRQVTDADSRTPTTTRRGLCFHLWCPHCSTRGFTMLIAGA